MPLPLTLPCFAVALAAMGVAMTEPPAGPVSGPERQAPGSTSKKRLKKWLAHHEWHIVAAVWLVSLVLGCLGFARHFGYLGEKRSAWDIFYLTLQLFTMESGSVPTADNWALDVARFLAPAAAVYTAITALAVVFRDELQTMRLRFLSNHVIICGLGRRGLRLTRGFLATGRRVVVIERDINNELVAHCREMGAAVVIGDASDEEVLKTAGAARAYVVISVCGEDGINAEVAVDARDLVKNRRRTPLKCVVQIDDLDLCRLLKGHEIAMGSADAFRLEFFNSYLLGAKAILEDHPAFEVSSDEAPHLLVIGAGRLGESLIVCAARAWRSRVSAGGEPLRVTVIDRKGEEKKKLLLLRNPFLGRVCDLACLNLEVESSEFLEGNFLFNSEGRSVVTRVYVCLDSDSRGLAAALILCKHLHGIDVPIVVRMSHEGGVGTLLHGVDEAREGFGSLFAFGLLERICTPDLVLGGTHEILAQAIFRNFSDGSRPCAAIAGEGSARGLWKDLPEHLKDSFRRHADQIGVMIKMAGCTIEPLAEWDADAFEFSEQETEALAASLHDFHLAEHRRGGLCLLPGLADARLDPNPTPVAWRRRSERTRQIYRHAVGCLPVFLAASDFQIYRLR